MRWTRKAIREALIQEEETETLVSEIAGLDPAAQHKIIQSIERGTGAAFVRRDQQGRLQFALARNAVLDTFRFAEEHGLQCVSSVFMPICNEEAPFKLRHKGPWGTNNAYWRYATFDLAAVEKEG